jgi:hypothetical protein
MSVVGELDLEDATMLVRLGALVARADSVHERAAPSGEIEFVGIFDRPRPSESTEAGRESRYSVPPPPAPDRSAEPKPAGVARAYRSVPPIQEIFEPRSGAGATRGEGAGSSAPKARSSGGWSPRLPGESSPPAPRTLQEPSRALFLPVANAALLALARHGKSYLQALFVVTLDRASHERDPARPSRLVVQLVIIDGAGILRALDPPAEVVEAAAEMVEADRREGNGHWRKLSARITPKPDGGASLHVDVT